MYAARRLFVSVLTITAVGNSAGLAARIGHVLIGVRDFEKTVNSLRAQYGFPAGGYGSKSFQNGPCPPGRYCPDDGCSWM